jgi:hypothetical protein
MKKIHIATALFGSSEEFIKNIPTQENDNYEINIKTYTDDNTYSRINALHPRTKGKIPKMLEWMSYEADYYIWMDAPFILHSNNIGVLVEKYLKESDICLFTHPWNKTVDDEVTQVLNGVKEEHPYLYSRYKGEPILEQYTSYINDPNYHDDKLFSLGFFIYKKTLVENKDYNLMTDWFFHNCYWSIEDQVSFPYLLNKHKIKHTTFTNGDIYQNEFAIYKF